jgi:hypothetical protein
LASPLASPFADRFPAFLPDPKPQSLSTLGPDNRKRVSST